MAARRPPPPQNGEPVTVLPQAYSQMPANAAARVAAATRSPAVRARAETALKDATGAMRQAVLQHVKTLEAAGLAGDLTALFEQAHEIRGLAGNAGLPAAGQLANGLCHYLDAAAGQPVVPDTGVIRLYIDAIARAARATDEATRLGGQVAVELDRLAKRKLSEINLA